MSLSHVPGLPCPHPTPGGSPRGQGLRPGESPVPPATYTPWPRTPPRRPQLPRGRSRDRDRGLCPPSGPLEAQAPGRFTSPRGFTSLQPREGGPPARACFYVCVSIDVCACAFLGVTHTCACVCACAFLGVIHTCVCVCACAFLGVIHTCVCVCA